MHVMVFYLIFWTGQWHSQRYFYLILAASIQIDFTVLSKWYAKLQDSYPCFRIILIQKGWLDLYGRCLLFNIFTSLVICHRQKTDFTVFTTIGRITRITKHIFKIIVSWRIFHFIMLTANFNILANQFWQSCTYN